MAKIPTVTMRGPAGSVVVNASDQTMYEAKGYKPVGAVAAGDRVTVREPQADEGYDFNRHTVAELREFAEETEIDSRGMNKAELVSALGEAEYNPGE